MSFLSYNCILYIIYKNASPEEKLLPVRYCIKERYGQFYLCNFCKLILDFQNVSHVDKSIRVVVCKFSVR